MIPGGKLGNRFACRAEFLTGVTGFALTSVGIGLIGTTDGVISPRVLHCVFGALPMPNTLAILRSALPPEKLNMAIGSGVARVSVDGRRADHRRANR